MNLMNLYNQRVALITSSVYNYLSTASCNINYYDAHMSLGMIKTSMIKLRL